MALTFIFVHGAWHNATHWADTIAELEKRGHRGRALDLPGHGGHAILPAGYAEQDLGMFASAPSAAATITVDEAAECVASALRECQGADRPVLVGHSMGGVIITKAAQLAPELIGRLIYISAYVPTGGRSAAYYGSLPEADTPYDKEVFVGDPAAIGAARINPRGSDDVLAKLRNLYYHDVPDDLARRHLSELTPDVPVAYWISAVATSPERWGSVRRSYIRCEMDHATLPALQDIMIADADADAPATRFEVLSLPSGHSPFASMPARLAESLIELSLR